MEGPVIIQALGVFKVLALRYLLYPFCLISPELQTKWWRTLAGPVARSSGSAEGNDLRPVLSKIPG